MARLSHLTWLRKYQVSVSGQMSHLTRSIPLTHLAKGKKKLSLIDLLVHVFDLCLIIRDLKKCTLMRVSEIRGEDLKNHKLQPHSPSFCLKFYHLVITLINPNLKSSRSYLIFLCPPYNLDSHPL